VSSWVVLAALGFEIACVCTDGHINAADRRTNATAVSVSNSNKVVYKTRFLFYFNRHFYVGVINVKVVAVLCSIVFAQSGPLCVIGLPGPTWVLNANGISVASEFSVVLTRWQTTLLGRSPNYAVLHCSIIIIIVAYLSLYPFFHACIIVRNKAVVDRRLRFVGGVKKYILPVYSMRYFTFCQIIL